MGQVSKHCGEWHPAENISSWKILEEKSNFGRSHAVWSSLSPVCGNCFQRLRSIWWAMEDHRPLETLEVSFCNVAICMFGFYWRMVLWWSYGSNMIWFWMWNLDPQQMTSSGRAVLKAQNFVTFLVVTCPGYWFRDRGLTKWLRSGMSRPFMRCGTVLDWAGTSMGSGEA